MVLSWVKIDGITLIKAALRGFLNTFKTKTFFHVMLDENNHNYDDIRGIFEYS